MTFVATETSRTLGEPVELYFFKSGPAQFAYTNADDPITIDGVTYDAVPIKRTNITSSGALDKATLTVSIDEGSPLAALLRQYPLSSIMSLKIRQGHASDPDQQYLVAWAGRVVSSKGGQSAREISCQPVSTSLRRNGLRRNWQLGCPHVLYGDRCRANQAAATVSFTCTIVARNRVLTSPNWYGSRPPLKFAGGLFIGTDGESRTILSVTDNGNGTAYLLLGGPLFQTGVVAAQASLGCNHQMDDCRNLHIPYDEAAYGGGNVHNFGGQPFIPQKTPIGFVSNY